MSTQDLILTSLEIVADNIGDITLPVYELYFRNCPDSQQLMSHIDDLVRGKMMEEVMRLIMLEDASVEDQYLTFEMKTHQQSYSVIESMYDSLLMAVWQVVRDGVGKDWDEDFEDAWDQRINALLGELIEHSPAVERRV